MVPTMNKLRSQKEKITLITEFLTIPMTMTKTTSMRMATGTRDRVVPGSIIVMVLTTMCPLATGTRTLKKVPGSIMEVLMMMKMATGTRDLVVPGSIIMVVIMMTMVTGTKDLKDLTGTKVLISHHHTHHTDHTDIAGCRVSMGEEANKLLPLPPLHPNLFQGVG